MIKSIGFVCMTTIFTYAISPLCNGSCTECKTWMPILKKTAIEFKKEYESIEQSVSEKYDADIKPLLSEKEKLLSQKLKFMKELEVLNKEIAKTLKNINHERKMI